MLFRHHRGSLDEAMRTVVEIPSKKALLREIKSHLSPHDSLKIDNVDDISFKHVGWDDRIKWDTYYVIVDGQVLGMSNGTLE